MADSGRENRSKRLTETLAGASGSSSADFMNLVRRLHRHSKEYAERIDGNCSPYALSAIPMLLSSLRCLVVEYASLRPTDPVALEILTRGNDFGLMLDHYNIEDPMRTDALLLQEIRNEIIHPAHRPSGTPDNWPEYLRSLKNRGLTQTTGTKDSDYLLLSQMQSHRLLIWACGVTHDLAAVILKSNAQKHSVLGDFLENYETVE